MLQPYMAELVGGSAWFRDLQIFIKKAANQSAPVLLLGEPGVGKEMLARSIHFSSRRKNHPFITVDSSLYYERELEREIFGISDPGCREKSRKGLLEFSNKGTCYISNVEELSLSIQERLFNYLETGYLQPIGTEKPISSKVRLIFSSSKNIRGFSDGGLFSKDLFDRFSGLLMEVSPLRKHPDDIVPFIIQMIQNYCTEQGRDPSTIDFSADALEALESYPWPGNYDELKAELLRVFRSGVAQVIRETLSPEILHHWIGRRGIPQVRKVIEELERYMQEFRIMVRLDVEYGDVLIDSGDWDVQLKCFDRY